MKQTQALVQTEESWIEVAVTLRERMRQLTAQSFIYGLSGALTKVAGLLMVPILLHLFTPADYAVIDLVTAFTSVIGGILLLGSDAAIGYYYYRETDLEGQRSLISTWFIFQFVLNIMAGAALFLFAAPAAQLLLGTSAHNQLYLQLIACVFPLSSSIGYILEIFRLQMRPLSYLTVSAVNVGSGLILSLVLVLWLNKGLTGVYLASTVTNVVAFAMALGGMRQTLRASFSRQRLLKILAYGTPLVPITVANWAIAVSNRFFIRAHTGMTDVGLFSSGSKVAQIMFLAVTAFALAWGPFAYSIAEEQDAKRTYARVLTFYVATLGWLAVALSILAPLILKVARPAYAPAYQVVPPLVIAYMVTGAYSIVAIGTSLSKKTIHLSWTTIIAAVVAVSLNAILPFLPGLALAGGALATMCGNLVSVALVYWVSQRLYPVSYELGKVGTCVALLALLILLGEASGLLVSATSLVGLALRLALLAAYPWLLVALGVIQRYEVVVLRNAIMSRANQQRQRYLTR